MRRIGGRAASRLRSLAAVVAGVVVATVAIVSPLGSAHVIADSFPTIDGQFSGVGVIGPNGVLNLSVTGRGGVPVSGVDAVAVNVAVTNPTMPSFLTIFPKGEQRPTAANLNFSVGQTIPNMVVAKVGADGQISIYNLAGTVDVIVDVLGWFPTGGSYHGLTPARLLDTRPGLPTIDGQAQGVGVIGPNGVLNLSVTGRGGVPVSGVDAVAVNVAVTNPTMPSFLTIFPKGEQRPTAANLNFSVGQTIPNMVVAKVGADGQISIYNLAGTVDVIVDVLGWFPTGGSYHGLTPARLLDTRPGLPTIDGQAQGVGVIGPNGVLNLSVTGRGGVPVSGVDAVAVNVAVTNPTMPSFLTIFPKGEQRPTAANLNFSVGQTIPNMVVAKVGADGQISIYNLAGTVDVIVDVLGWFPTGGSYHGLTPARLLDTRTPPPTPPAAIGAIRNLLVVRPTLHQMAGVDRVAVWVCDVPTDTIAGDYAYSAARLPVDPAIVAAWANSTMTPYFQRSSGGRYRPTFESLGYIALDQNDGTNDCLSKAQALTGRPYTNVIAADNSTQGDGYGGPGLIYTSDSSNLNLFDTPPSRSQRGLWIGGNSVDTVSGAGHPNPAVLAHELGHTLHWPHSFSGGRPTEYDNPIDLMSGTTPYECRRDLGPGSYESWYCDVQNTIAFNRFAAGWIDENQVVVHSGGTTSATLDSPQGGGVQFIAAPDPTNPKVMLTIEARPAVGDDQHLGKEGVALHIIDQRSGACPHFGGGSTSCISADRRQRQVPYSDDDPYLHVLSVGSSATVAGVTVAVTGRIGNAYAVTVSGTFTAPAPALNTFALTATTDIFRPHG